jgi:cell wall assembly regulator SMI1
VNMNELIERIRREHKFNPPLPEVQIAAMEEQLEYKLPDDLKEFYRYCNGAALFEDANWPFTFVPLEEFHRVTIDILGEEDDEWAPYTKSWYSVCDVWDGNYIAADLSSVNGSHCWLIDCFHETYSDGDVIALSFTEFLEQALNSEGGHYWLNANFRSYGRLYQHDE